MSTDPRDPRAPDSKPPTEARRTTLRMRTVSAAPPSRPDAAPPASGPKAPASRPTGAESETYGRIHRIVEWVDQNKGAFAISRLISQLGVNLRAFGRDTKDDARVLAKLWPALDLLLSEAEREGLLRRLREG